MYFGSCTTTPADLYLFKEYGYASFEANFQKIRAMDNEEFDALGRAVEETHVVLEGMNCFAPADSRFLSWSDAEADEYFESGIARAKPLGLTYMVIGSGRARMAPEGMSHEEGMQRLIKRFRRFAEIADTYQVDLYIEPLRHYETDVINTIDEAVAFCKAVDHPNVGCVADFYHLKMVGDDFANLANAGPFLKQIHMATADRRIPLLADKAEVLAMSEALKAVGYDGRVTLEGAAKPDAKTALKEFSEQFILFE